MKLLQYNILDIIRGTTVDGPGFRTSIYFSGCIHKCQGCHNPQSWNPDEGQVMNLSEILAIVEEEDFDVTLTGGDPLYYPEKTAILIEALKKKGRNVWVYTGYTWEEILGNLNLKESILNADVLVDGPFIQELKSPDLPFRGSSNQRLIDVSRSMKAGKVIEIIR